MQLLISISPADCADYRWFLYPNSLPFREKPTKISSAYICGICGTTNHWFYKPFTFLNTPDLILSTLKFTKMASFKSVTFRYVSTCLWCTSAKWATDLTSIITLFSTNKSSLNPTSNFPLYNKQAQVLLSWLLILLFKLYYDCCYIYRFQQSWT